MPDRTRNIHERFLRHIWSRQYLDQSNLRTTDGKPLRVLEAGKLNLDGGPDFSDAKIKIGGTTFFGDVEIHRSVAEWFSHAHQNDARYNRVILHVVLQAGPKHFLTTSLSGRTIPVLILGEHLSEPIQSIWQRAILDEQARKSETIKCFPGNSAVSDLVLNGWLRKLATERLELKLRRFEERLRMLAYERLMAIREHPKTYGEPAVEGYPDEIPPPFKELTQNDFANKDLWEQILFEGLMEGLGYAKNREPFLKLAQCLTLSELRRLQLAGDDQRRIAVLFAVAGLLPKIKTLKERESKEYARQLLRAWNDVRLSVHVGKLHPSEWQFFPTRPNNFPTLRMSAANVLLARLLNDNLFRSMIQTLKSDNNPAESRKTLSRLLSVQSSGFWQHHYDFDQPARTTMVPLGLSRVNELLVNTVVPISLLYARIFKDPAVRENTLLVYESFPPLEENSLSRLMRTQLLGNKVQVASAGSQQGLIQLYKYYCIEQRCAECEVGKVVFAHDER
ncbi:MAG TPA: DUF2851 family protein [Bacteroidota bacterium]